MNEEDYKEQIRLVELDLSQTNEFIKGVVSTGAAVRASAVTIWLALLGFAVQQHLSALAWLALVVSAIFGMIDGFYGWLYAEAAKHARAAEKVSTSYYSALNRGEDDEDAVLDFETDLRVHRFGLFSSFPSFRFGLLWNARPRLLYQLLYPALIIIAVATAVLISAGVIASSAPKPTHVIIEQQK